MKREILINGSQRETRVAILEDDRLVELLVDRPDHRRTVGDIYLGRVEAVLPGIQAAFVDIGQEKSAFLHASDLLEPDEDEEPEDDEAEEVTEGGEVDQPAAAEAGVVEDPSPEPSPRKGGWRSRDRRRREMVLPQRSRRRGSPARDLSPPRAPQHPGHPQEGSEPPGPGHQGADRLQGMPGHRPDLPPRPFPGLHALRLQGGGEPQDREPGAARQAARDGVQAAAQGYGRRHRADRGGRVSPRSTSAGKSIRCSPCGRRSTGRRASSAGRRRCSSGRPVSPGASSGTCSAPRWTRSTWT